MLASSANIDMLFSSHSGFAMPGTSVPGHCLCLDGLEASAKNLL